MRAKGQLKIDNLYFGVVMHPLSYGTYDERNELRTYNLFDMSSIKLAVAKWVTMTPNEKARIDNPLVYIFGDVWGRTEFEFIMCPWPYKDGEKVEDNGKKVDIYQMYVMPNRVMLLDMVDAVSKSSAQEYLRTWHKAYRKK